MVGTLSVALPAGVDPAEPEFGLVDTHIHLDAAEFDADRAEVAQAVRNAGVSCFVVPAVDVSSFGRIRQLAAQRTDVVFALGIHPLYVDKAEDDDLVRLAAALEEGGAVAIGEIGLDFFVPGLDPMLQERFFTAQLALAHDLDLPVILHVRRAVDAILKQLRRFRVRGGIAHAFNGSRQQAEAFIALGFKLGFGGAMSFEGSRRIRELARELPLDCLVLETDAPDIPPAWARGQRNAPENLARYAALLAELRDVPVAEVIRATTRNACNALPGLAARLGR